MSVYTAYTNNHSRQDWLFCGQTLVSFLCVFLSIAQCHLNNYHRSSPTASAAVHREICNRLQLKNACIYTDIYLLVSVTLGGDRNVYISQVLTRPPYFVLSALNFYSALCLPISVASPVLIMAPTKPI